MSRPKKSRQPKKPQWVRFAASLAPDPRQSEKSSEPQRFVHALILKDSRGRLYERLGHLPPAPIDDPPEE
jgi:hypothetical protein